MRLLVDGLNTLPEKATSPTAVPPDAANPPKPETLSPAAAYAKAVRMLGIGQRAARHARHYIMDPKKSKVYAVRGFATETGDQGGYLTFKVVEASKVLAARQQFTDQLGLITIALYQLIIHHEPGSRSRSAIATTTGKYERADIPEVKDIDCGKPIAVIHIHYVDPEELKEDRPVKRSDVTFTMRSVLTWRIQSQKQKPTVLCKCSRSLRPLRCSGQRERLMARTSRVITGSSRHISIQGDIPKRTAWRNRR